MQKVFLGIDIGSISTKGAAINQNQDIVWEKYIWTEGNPINAVKTLMNDLTQRKEYEIAAIGTTGSARKLAGAMLNADIVKNEITAHAIGTLSRYPDVKTIFEIGGQDSKIIIIENGIVVDYAMNTLCAAGTGAFLSSQALRLGVDIEQFGNLALKSERPAKIAARCTVFAESDLVHKAQIGYKKEEIIAGLCFAVVNNYLNNLCKGKVIKPPVVFQGGVSKNAGVVKAFKEAVGEVYVDEKGHLMGALGAAILAKNCGSARGFDLSLLEMPFETKGGECSKCDNNCELINIYRGDRLIDIWGSRCGCITPEKNRDISV